MCRFTRREFNLCTDTVHSAGLTLHFVPRGVCQPYEAASDIFPVNVE